MPVKGSRILIPGASYKGGVGDTRESPALRVIDVLRNPGAIVSYNDPYIPALVQFGLESVELDSALDTADALVLVTAQPGIDYGEVLERSPVMVDLRGVTRKLSKLQAGVEPEERVLASVAPSS